jgi:hypothetical protein
MLLPQPGDLGIEHRSAFQPCRVRDQGVDRARLNHDRPGIFAKALVMRASVTGAAKLAMSLAKDLFACPELGATLRPAGSESAEPPGR